MEQTLTRGLDTANHVAISFFDHSHELLDHSNRLARRLADQKEQVDTFLARQQAVTRQQLLNLNEDLKLVGEEAIQGVFVLLQKVIAEAGELRKSSSQLVDELKTESGLQNPFRSTPPNGQATIIPISIQDN